MKLKKDFDNDYEYGSEHMSGTSIFILVSLFVLLILAKRLC